MLRACVMLLNHIGMNDKARRLEKALDICVYEEKKLTITGRETGCTCEEFGQYVKDTINRV
jgi:isocitrate dehydrogenase (NAD+)